jgi:hypothetical protein
MARDDVKPDAPSHTPGTPRGEDVLRKQGDAGYRGNTRMSSDATGINPDASKPIDPRMPNLPPA